MAGSMLRHLGLAWRLAPKVLVERYMISSGCTGGLLESLG